jgi:hypothetical protein
MTRKYTVILMCLIVGMAIMLSGCAKKSQETMDSEAEMVAAMDNSMAAQVQAEAEAEEPLPDQARTDANETAGEGVEENAEEPASNATDAEEPEKPDTGIHYVNPNMEQDLFVIRDEKSGCEWIQVDNSHGLVVIPRPKGPGGEQFCEKK